MRISPIYNNYYQNNRTIQNQKINFTQAKKKNDVSTDGLLKIWAVGALTGLAVAYGGGRMILVDYEKSVNEILDRYEQEIKAQKASLDSIYNEFDKTYSIDEINIEE